MNEEEFLEKWHKEKVIYDAWGHLVQQKIDESVQFAIQPRKLDDFLKVPAVPRVKKDDRLLEKAFHRGKNYPDPYGDIEDKVGVRYVPLLLEELPIIVNCLVGISSWHAEKARDFIEEQAASPHSFNYSAIHFVVRSLGIQTHDGQQIPHNTPCEVQIKTLLQHAYSEVTHDSIYKPSLSVTPEMNRAAATSMALLEATDYYFERLNELVKNETEHRKQASAQFTTLYQTATGHAPVAGYLDNVLMDGLLKLYEGINPEQIAEFLTSKPYIGEWIIRERENDPLFAQPTIVFAFYLAGNKPNALIKAWPASQALLEPILTALGQNPNR